MNFQLNQKGSDTFVTFDTMESDIIKKYTVPFNKFQEFVANLTVDNNSSSSSVLEDTGFISNNLIRRVKYDTFHKLYFYYPSITAVFKNTVDCNVVGHKTLRDFLAVAKNVEVKDYSNNKKLFVLTKGLEVKDVYYYHKTLHGRMNFEEKVLFGIPPERQGLFTSTAKDFNTERVVTSFMPNHFANSICWGGTGVVEEDHSKEAYLGNITDISVHPKLYLNTTFNNDLMFRDTKNCGYRNLSKEEQTMVLMFYKDYFELEDTKLIKEIFLFSSSLGSHLITYALAASLPFRTKVLSSISKPLIHI